MSQMKKEKKGISRKWEEAGGGGGVGRRELWG